MASNYQASGGGGYDNRGGGGYDRGGGRGGGRNTYRGRGGARTSGGGRDYRGGGNRYQGERGGRYQGGRNDGRTYIHTKLRSPCRNWVETGACPDSNCMYSHVVQRHANVSASSYLPQDQQHQDGHNQHQHQQQIKAAISDVAIWETQGQIKIFTGSHDGFWRLWNTSANFAKEFETKVGLKVTCVNVTNSFLFCGMEAIGHAVPDTSVGMVHAWNLTQPNVPPLELQLGNFLPYAHNQCVTALTVQDAHVVTGSRDGSIRVWTFANNTFVLDKSLAGHAREVTGLVVTKDAQALLWSSSIDGSIRIWDFLKSGDCQYSIPKQPASAINASTPTVPASAGHSGAVTALETFHSPAVAGTFVLSASLDGTIKAWNGTTGECVASEAHGEGVVSLAIVNADVTQTQPKLVLLVGLESGGIMARNLVQTSKAAAFEAIFLLKGYTGHHGAVKCIIPGPQATFYTGGNDGNMMVWQINGDLGI